ncbi:hypothetical protein AB0M44_13760 [Streptosporangium subroseum]|uniref:hypothetical protein n=1 Tax=Streptosporangium subroseum TaxID=106412 RepID=UPI00342B2459
MGDETYRRDGVSLKTVSLERWTDANVRAVFQDRSPTLLWQVRRTKNGTIVRVVAGKTIAAMSIGCQGGGDRTEHSDTNS